MRNILLILFLLLSYVSFGQPGYTLINHRYNWKTGAFTELTIPASSTHALATGQWRRAGAVMVDTSGADSGFYYMGENQVWHKLAKEGDVVTTASNALTKSSNDIKWGGVQTENTTVGAYGGTVYNTKFTNQNIFSVDTARQWRLRSWRPTDSAMMYIQSSLYGSSGLKRINISAEDSDYLSTIIIDHDHITNEHYHNNPDVLNTQFITGVNSFGFINYTPEAQLGFQADSFYWKPFLGLINIDTLRDAHGSDTARNKPMVYDPTTGMWRYSTYWPSGGGASVSFGTDNQIPHMNSGGTDFDYDADFTWDGATLYTSSGASTTGNIFVVPDGGSTYAMAQDASPGGGEHYLRFFRTSNVHLLEASHPNSGEFTIRNVGAGPFQLQSAASQELRLRPGATTTTVFTSSGQTFTYQSTNELQSLFKDISAPSTPASGYGSLYTNSDKLNFKDDGGNVYILERLASGSRTATATNGTNVASSTPAEEHYIRVGNVVHVSGKVTIDCTSASVSSVIDLDIPIASAFTTATDLAGTLVSEANASVTVGRIEAETTNDRLTITFIPYSDASLIYSYTYSYKIL